MPALPTKTERKPGQALREQFWTRMPLGVTYCPACGAKRPDQGQGCTCSGCGYSPLPSRAYPANSSFNLEYSMRLRAKLGI